MRRLVIKRIISFGVMSGFISLMLACVGFGVVEFYKIRNESVTRLNSQMDMLTYSFKPILAFDDRDAAEKTLKSIQNDPSINAIRIYKANRKFASFERSKNRGDLKVTKPIIYNAKIIGRIDIESVYVGMWERYLSYLLICLLIIVISIPASYIISGPLRRQVSLGVNQLDEQSDRLRLLADQVLTTEQRERKRIAAIIHDHLQQFLVACKLKLVLTTRSLEKKDYLKSRTNLNDLDELLDRATDAARTLTVELRPPVLYEDGLDAAFKWLVNKFKKEHDLEIILESEEIPGPLTDNLKIMVFESVKELLFNVVKYAGVQKVFLSLKYKSGHIVVRVKDDGHGFDVDHIEEKSSDKGFGLFSIRERLKVLNGRFKVISKPGQGTEVELIIPAEISVERVQIHQGEPVHKKFIGSQKNINIILADDHTIVRQGIANLLKEQAQFHVVAQAENGLEAVQKVEKYNPDVVIMDINMPHLNGIEATRIIKNKFPHISVVGLSVQFDDEVADSMKKAGAFTLVNKAGDPQELIQVILSCVKSPLH